MKVDVNGKTVYVEVHLANERLGSPGSKVLLTSLLLAPVMWYNGFGIWDKDLQNWGTGKFFLLVTATGLIYSIPCFFLLRAVVKAALRQSWPLPFKKLLVAAVTASSYTAAFAYLVTDDGNSWYWGGRLWEDTEDTAGVAFISAYVGVGVLSVWAWNWPGRKAEIASF